MKPSEMTISIYRGGITLTRNNDLECNNYFLIDYLEFNNQVYITFISFSIREYK